MKMNIRKIGLAALLVGALSTGCGKAKLEDSNILGFNLTEKKEAVTRDRSPLTVYETQEGYKIVKRGESDYYIFNGCGILINEGNKAIIKERENILVGTPTINVREGAFSEIRPPEGPNSANATWILNFAKTLPLRERISVFEYDPYRDWIFYSGI